MSIPVYLSHTEPNHIYTRRRNETALKKNKEKRVTLCHHIRAGEWWKKVKRKKDWLLAQQTFLIDGMIAMKHFKLLKLNNIIYYERRTFIARTQCMPPTHSYNSSLYTHTHTHQQAQSNNAIHSLGRHFRFFFSVSSFNFHHPQMVHINM